MKKFKSLLAILFFVTFSTAVFADVVCHEPGIQGCRGSANRALSYVGVAKTHKSSEVKVYVERTQTGYYFHSNYIASGYSYPTKIFVSKPVDAETAFLNLLFSEPPDMPARQQALTVMKKDATFLLDASVFGETGRPVFDMDSIQKIKVVADDGKLIDAETLITNNPPPLIISRVSGSYLYGIPPHMANAIKTRLDNRKYNQTEASILNFTMDSATEIALQKSSTLSKLLNPIQGKMIDSEVKLREAFSKARGKTLFFVGHVENGSYVIRNAMDTVVFSIEISNMRRISKEYDIELIDFGCRTAQAIKGDALSFGVTTEFNSIDLLNRLEVSVSGATSYADILEKLATAELTTKD